MILCSKKNYERKKYKARSFHDTSSLQIDDPPLLSVEDTETESSTENLRDKLQLESLNGKIKWHYIYNNIFQHFTGWIISFGEDCQVIRLCKLKCSDTTAKVNFCVAVRPDFSWANISIL